MISTRRGFLGHLALLAGAGTTLDLEQLLWTPHQRTHILPPPRGWRPSSPPGLTFHKNAFVLVAPSLVTGFWGAEFFDAPPGFWSANWSA
jgi:hypothetical protein